MKPQLTSFKYELEPGSIHHFHSDLNELLEQLTLIYKSREGIIHPKFGFCKELISSNNHLFPPFRINHIGNDSESK